MHRANNFDVLRLCFAAIVVLAHCADLSQQHSLSWAARLVNSRVAVEGFFAMSGYLIVASYERSSSFISYVRKRALRILPAYWATLLFSLLLGSALSTLPLSQFAESFDTWKYIFANLTFANFLHPSLPGLFVHNPEDSAVNGALWTIKIELMFYLLVPAIAALCRRFGAWQSLLVLFLLSILYQAGCERLHQPKLAKQFPGQLCFFVVGILVHYHLPLIFLYRKWVLAITVFAYCAYLTLGGIALEAIAVPLAVFCVAFLFPHVQGPTKYGDFSYGIYVFHFPIIQALIAVGLFDKSPCLAMGTVFASVTLLAIASWKLIESPSLRL
jgi:peptidoglycan/LPS O-acetylase OafA/YrhL